MIAERKKNNSDFVLGGLAGFTLAVLLCFSAFPVATVSAAQAGAGISIGLEVKSACLDAPTVTAEIVNYYTARIFGTTVANGKVYLTITGDNGYAYSATVTAAPDGKYTYSTPALNIGNYTADVYAKDYKDNKCPTADPVSFSIVCAEPPTTLKLLDNHRVRATGSGFPEGTIHITITGKNSYVYETDVVVGPDGAWSFTSHGLGIGAYSFYAYTVDKIGNQCPPFGPEEFNISEPKSTDESTSEETLIDKIGNILSPLLPGTEEPEQAPPMVEEEGGVPVESRVIQPATCGSPLDQFFSWLPFLTLILILILPLLFLFLQHLKKGGIEIVRHYRVLIFGRAPASREVRLTLIGDNGFALAVTDKAGADGKFIYLSPVLNAGNYEVEAQAETVFGRKKQVLALQKFTITVVKPQVVLDILDDGKFKAEGTGFPGKTAHLAIEDEKSGGVENTIAVGVDGEWTYVSPKLKKGTYSFYAYTEDRLGNKSASYQSESFSILQETRK